MGEVRVIGTLVPAEAFEGVVGELDPITVDLVISVTNGVKVVRGTSEVFSLVYDEPQVYVEVVALSWTPSLKDELGLFLEHLCGWWFRDFGKRPRDVPTAYLRPRRYCR